MSALAAWLRPRRLHLYLVHQLLLGIVVVLPVVLAMHLLILLPGIEVEATLGTDYVLAFIGLLLLNLPAIIDFNLPFIVLLGAMLGLGRLAEGGEISAMRFAGASVGGISAAVALAGAVLAGAHFTFKEQVVTRADLSLRLQGAARQIDVSSARYHWLRSPGELVGFATTERQLGHYRDMMVLRLDGAGGIEEVLRAEEAHHLGAQAGGESWRLDGVRIDSFVDNSSRALPSLVVDDLLSIPGGNLLGLRAGELSWGNMAPLECHPRPSLSSDIESYCLEYWGRLGNSLLLFSLALFASTFIYGLARVYPVSLRMMGGLLVAALCIGIGNSVPYLAKSTALPYWLLATGPALALLAISVLRLRLIARRI